MNNSSLEITENEYCIKLNRDTFNLSLVHQLIKRIQAEASFFSSKNDCLEEDIISRNQADFDGIFDYLDDK
jgi:hypothetical protein